MSSTTTERTLCNSLTQKFDYLIAPIEKSKLSFDLRISEFEAKLNSITFSSTTDLNNALSALEDQVKEITPGDGLEDMEKIREFLKNCLYLDIENPIASIIGSIKGLFDRVDNFIATFSITIPEIDLGKLGHDINKTLGVDIPGFPGIEFPNIGNFSDLFSKSDKLINCVANLCDTVEYQSFVISASSKIDGLYDKFNVISNPLDVNYGKFDFSSVYSKVGLSSSQITKVNTAINGVSNIKGNALTSVNSTVSKAKSLIKKGGFF